MKFCRDLRVSTVLILLFGSLSGCGKKQQIPYHPVMNMTARNIERYNAVPLIISDEKRATAIQEILKEVWLLGRNFNEQRNQELTDLVTHVGGDAEGALAAAVPARRIHEHAQVLWREYSRLMLQLRSLVSCAEYRSLLAANGFKLNKEEQCSGQL